MIDRDEVLLLLGVGVVGGQRNTKPREQRRARFEHLHLVELGQPVSHLPVAVDPATARAASFS